MHIDIRVAPPGPGYDGCQCATGRHLRHRHAELATAGDPATAVMIALRSLARRHQQLSVEITDLDRLIKVLVTAINPRLIAANGVGPDVAGQLLVTAGDNPHRLRSEAAFAMLFCAAPLPAFPGRTNRHRLNRGGDRQANRARSVGARSAAAERGADPAVAPPAWTWQLGDDETARSRRGARDHHYRADGPVRRQSPVPRSTVAGHAAQDGASR